MWSWLFLKSLFSPCLLFSGCTQAAHRIPFCSLQHGPSLTPPCSPWLYVTFHDIGHVLSMVFSDEGGDSCSQITEEKQRLGSRNPDCAQASLITARTRVSQRLVLCCFHWRMESPTPSSRDGKSLQMGRGSSCSPEATPWPPGSSLEVDNGSHQSQVIREGLSRHG